MTGKKKRTIIIAVAAVLLALAVWTVWSNTALELNTYTVSSEALPDAFDGYRIAHVSDLHNAEMGDGNEKLLAMLREAELDMIAITGDMIDSRNTDVEVALNFAEKAMQIAPCYYVTGNHEARVSEYDELKAGLEACGVIILENEREQIEMSGEFILFWVWMIPVFIPITYSEILHPWSAALWRRSQLRTMGLLSCSPTDQNCSIPMWRVVWI